MRKQPNVFTLLESLTAVGRTLEELGRAIKVAPPRAWTASLMNRYSESPRQSIEEAWTDVGDNLRGAMREFEEAEQVH